MEKTLLSNLEQEDRLPFQGLPLVIVFAPDVAGLPFQELESLREEGQALADRFEKKNFFQAFLLKLCLFLSLQCPFIDVIENSDRRSSGAPKEAGLFKENLVEDALRALIESIRHRSGLLNIYKSTPNNAEPDIR